MQVVAMEITSRYDEVVAMEREANVLAKV